MKLKNVTQDKLYKQVRNKILKIIIERNLGPNELLPSEGELAELYGVSKMTSKLALNLLMEEGVVTRIPRRGSFLNNIDINIIRGLIDDTNFINNTADRANFIALILPTVDSYIGDIIKGIEKEAKAKKLNIVIKFSNGIKEGTDEIICEMSKTPEIKGIILFPEDSNICGRELLKLKVKNYPIVIIDRVFKEVRFDSVFHNYFKGTKDMVNYLIGKGHKNIGYISGSISNITSSEEKYQGYISGMMENNLLIKNEYIHLIKDTLDSKDMEDYIRVNKDITAVVCADDYIAAKVFYVATSLGKNIPIDLSVTGFSDNNLLRFIPIQITTVKQPVEELCVNAVNLLLSRISDSSTITQTIKVENEIIERASVADVRKTSKK